jgi:hypothetical protein
MKARQQNRDMFLHDGAVTGRDGSPVRYTVMVLFDGSLPVTIPAKETNADTTAEAPAAEPAAAE